MRFSSASHQPTCRQFSVWSLGLIAFGLLTAPSLATSKPSQRYPWLRTSKITVTSTIAKRFSPPCGFTRPHLRKPSFAYWLRHLPLMPKGTPVRYHNGARKPTRHHAAVIAIDTGKRNLQQCADAFIRLWGEYLWSRGKAKRTNFQFVSGHSNPWSRWARGDRRRFRKGRVVGWRRRVRRPDRSYTNYRRYLWYAMAWANTTSLTRQLTRIPRAKVRPGDLLLQGWRNGSYGHAVVILDVVQDAKGRKRYLLGQSYMPAQSFHVLKAPGQRTSPWYRFPRRGLIRTPEWDFTTKDFYRVR